MVKMRPKLPLRGTAKKRFFWGDIKHRNHFFICFQENRLPGKMIYCSKIEVLFYGKP